MKTKIRIVYALPLVILPALAVAFGGGGARWAWMWWIAFALFFACKCLTLLEIQSGFPLKDCLAYFLLWPGMDAQAFFNRTKPDRAGRALGRAAFRNMLAGGLLLVAAGALLEKGQVGLAALAGMAGPIFLLHFGLFHLLTLLCRRAGRPVESLMDNPAAARSLAEFWGRRWNRGFNHLIRVYVFNPLTGVLKPAHALLFSFLVSGWIHELVITLPAGGGYGGPTLYFLAQGLGVMLEKHAFLRHRPKTRRVWTLLWVTLLFPLLFPPVFVRNIIFPMLHAWGITQGVPV